MKMGKNLTVPSHYPVGKELGLLHHRSCYVICLSKHPMSRSASTGVTGNWAKPSGVKKRKAHEDLGNEQRLAKRFDLLNLGNIDKSTRQPL